MARQPALHLVTVAFLPFLASAVQGDPNPEQWGVNQEQRAGLPLSASPTCACFVRLLLLLLA